MAADKTVSICFRAFLSFMALWEIAAAGVSRGLTSMVNSLVLAHCAQQAVSVPAANLGQGNGAKK